MSLTTDTTGYLQQEVLRNAKYLVLTVDRHGLVAKQECPGLKWRIEGVNTGQRLPEDLQGIVDSTLGQTTPQLIPFVNLAGDLIADVHVLNRGDDKQIILQDVSGGHEHERKLQQKAHEVSLLLEQQAKLNLLLELKKQEAESASQAKSRFIASMSHEFKSPISSIMIHADRLKASDPDAREPAAIARASWYLLTLVDNLLTHASSEEKGPRLHHTVVDVPRLFGDLQDMFSNQAESRGLAFRVDCDEQVSALVTDELRLRQVLINLLSNALRYTDKGHVRLVCEAGTGCTSFRVEDSGIGIDHSNLEIIFRPFERLNAGANGGAGLGLAICRSLVEAMGGAIEVESMPGKGSKFSFSLPATVELDGDLPARLSGLSILLVEDDDDLRETYRILLEDWGMNVRTASGYSGALALFQCQTSDMVMTDHYLADGNGLDLLARLKKESPRLKTVLCSGADLSGQGDRNVDLHLGKPVSAERLHRSLSSIAPV